MASMNSSTREKTTRERELDELLARAGRTETAEEIYQRIRAAGGSRVDVVVELKNLTGATVSPKSMISWWDTADAATT